MISALRCALLVLLGATGGLFVGVGAAALFSALGMPGRFAMYAGDPRMLKPMAWSCIVGFALGLCAYLFNFSARLPCAFSAIFGALAGAFVGILACALAEMLEAMPVLSGGRFGKAMHVSLYAMAIGKCVFSLWDLLRTAM